MKIGILSDTHCEFGTQAEIKLEETVDVLILAGDIDSGKRLIGRASQIGNRHAGAIFVITGNHEYYGDRIDKVNRRIQEELDSYNSGGYGETFGIPIHFLNNSAVDLDGVRFIGGTTWTDFGLYGNAPIAMMHAMGAMTDFRRISIHENGQYRKLRPNDQRNMNGEAKMFLFGELSKAREEDREDRVVVVTHHAPTELSVDPMFEGSPLNPAYANRWDNEIHYVGGPKLWIHGHMHASKDYMIDKTRVICNPYGYPGQNDNPTFKIVEI